MGTAVKEDLFEASSYCKNNVYFFETTPRVVHSFKVVCHFIFREEKRPAIHFFDRTDFFWRITLSHPFFHGGLFFAGAVAAMYSFRGYMEQIIFDSSCLLRTDTFLEDLF